MTVKGRVFMVRRVQHSRRRYFVVFALCVTVAIGYLAVFVAPYFEIAQSKQLARELAQQVVGIHQISSDGEYPSALEVPVTHYGVTRLAALNLGYTPPAFSRYLLTENTDGVWLLNVSLGANWVSLKLRKGDVFPLGQALHVVSEVHDGLSITLKCNINAERLGVDWQPTVPHYWYICMNSDDPRSTPELKDGIRQQDRVRIAKIKSEPLSATIDLSPRYSPATVTGKEIWHPIQATLRPGDRWKPRSYTYEVVSIVPPSQTSLGNPVGWVELRLVE